jgi:uncharacterized protein YoxC
MVQTWQAIALVLLALLVGAAVPTLLQLRRTLKKAETLIDTTGPRLDRALDDVNQALERINRVGEGVQEGAQRLRPVLDAVGSLVQSLIPVKESARLVAAVGGAVGPALVAAARASGIRAPRGGGGATTRKGGPSPS